MGAGHSGWRPYKEGTSMNWTLTPTQITTISMADASSTSAVQSATEEANAFLNQLAREKKYVASITAQTVAVYDQGYAAGLYTHIITIVHEAYE